MSELGNTISQIRSIGRHRLATIEIPDRPIGIKTPLERGTKSSESLFKMHYDIEKQIEDNLKNLIMTQKGERIGFPDFGTSLKSIYSNNSLTEDQVADIASEQIKEVVSKYMPSIRLTDFYSSKLSNNEKLNASNEIANQFINQQNLDFNIDSPSIQVENNLSLELDSIFQITIDYLIPLLNKKKSIKLRINSSK